MDETTKMKQCEEAAQRLLAAANPLVAWALRAEEDIDAAYGMCRTSQELRDTKAIPKEILDMEAAIDFAEGK